MLDTQIQIISESFAKALKQLGAPAGTAINLERPRQASNGDLACTVALQCAKSLKKNPREIATQIVSILENDPDFKNIVSQVSIAGPGFINMTYSNDSKQSVVKAILANPEKFGHSDEHKGESVIIEYVSANPTGPLHLGHARQGALGDVLANIFTTQGWNVTREFYYNDAGVQIHKLAISVQARAKELLGENVQFPEDGYMGSYIIDIAKDYLEKKSIRTFDDKIIESSGDVNDLSLIRRYAVAYLRNEQYSDLNALGVAFDNYYLESSLYSDGLVDRAVQAIKDAGKTYEKDGALFFKSTDFGDEKDRVMRKTDGGYTYFVPDVAYHLTKFERGFTKAIDIQGTDHFGTVKRVRGGIQAAASTLGLNVPKDFPDYMLHTMLHVLMDGKEVKMSKRAGTYVTLRDLVDWVGRDAARLFLVNRKCDAEFNFDVDLAKSQSDENPVYYLQYAHARICSVLKIAEEKGFSIPTEAEVSSLDLSPLSTPAEESLILRLSEYPKILKFSATELSPHTVANYLKDLSADFHSFYNACRVLSENEKERNARLTLLLATRQVLRNGLKILGVSAPERLERENSEKDS